MIFPILLEVNVSGEASKYGFQPGGAACCGGDHCNATKACHAGPDDDGADAADPEDVRPFFIALRTLRDDLAQRYPALDWRHLSMGMTDNFEVAIEEGATIVRIGRAIFGERPRTA